MHDIKAIREETEAFDAAIMRRPDIDTSELLRFLKDVKEHADAFETVGALDFENGVRQTPGEILRLIDLNRRRLIAEAEQHAGNANKFAKRAGQAKASGDQETFQAIIRTANSYKEEAKQIEAARSAVDDILERALLTLPNLPLPDVPDGADEDDNVEIRRRGTPPEFDFTPLEHFDIPAAKPGMDFETAAKLAGSRFALLSGAVARVHRALAQFMLDVHTTENGLTEVMPPVLVRDEAMLGTGQLPKFAEDSYVTTNGWWLIPTSEVPLTNIVAGLIVDEDDLPRRYTAHTLCFRSEAGSAGKDTAGMLRQHQFEKVEMVSITHPDRSLDEHERMTRCAEDILERLGLPYRTVVLCTGDMGFGARKTHDIEVWLPGQNTYREISSVSVCGDFQARRMNARFRPAGGGKPEFVHTLNGSGLAVGRCLIAVLENGQQADGSVLLPDVLGPWLGGKTRIGADGQLV